MISAHLAELALILQILGAGVALVRDYREIRDSRKKDDREGETRGE